MAGEIWRTAPALEEQIRLPQGPVSAGKWPGNSSRGALNLFLSVQTKPCLGHCTTRGLSLRRQATIFRLCGAAFFSGRMRAPSEIGMRLRGQDAYALCRADVRQMYLPLMRNIDFCGSAIRRRGGERSRIESTIDRRTEAHGGLPAS
jgi:hypothetical protein